MKNAYFFILFFFVLSSCALLPRYKKQPDGVRMVHYHTGYEYRGVSIWEWFFKYKNPRYGQGYENLVKDPSAVHSSLKSKYKTRVKDRRTYAKPLTEEQWIKLLAPDTANTATKDSTSLASNTTGKSKKKLKTKITVDTESAGVIEENKDSENKK